MSIRRSVRLLPVAWLVAGLALHAAGTAPASPPATQTR